MPLDLEEVNDHRRQIAQLLDRDYQAKSSKEIKQVYEEWADDYDADVQALGWNFPPRVAELLGQLLPPPAGLVLHAL